ncbi:MAG: TerB family tellurite resistance protein [Pseudomonadota bacterium]
MHIILGALTSIVTILWLLHRLAEMGIDLGGLNPWLWHRRRKWRQQYQGNAIFHVTSPMEVAALLIAGTAKADGDMSSEEKAEILRIFEDEFGLSKRDAAALLISSTYLLGKGNELYEQLKRVLKPSQEKFSEEQAESTVALMRLIAQRDGDAHEVKDALITEAEQLLREPHEKANQKWS